MKPFAVTTRHGTYNGYQNFGCRCDKCRDANTAYLHTLMVARVKRFKANSTLAPHGSDSTYRNWGCRCRPCTDAATRTRKRYRVRAS